MCCYCDNRSHDSILTDILLNCVPSDVFTCDAGWSIAAEVWGLRGTFCGDGTISREQWKCVCKKRANYLSR